MGILRKAFIGSLIVGAGALALAQNKKTVVKIRKSVAKAAKRVLHNGVLHNGLNKKSRRFSTSKLSKRSSS